MGEETREQVGAGLGQTRKGGPPRIVMTLEDEARSQVGNGSPLEKGEVKAKGFREVRVGGPNV